MKILQWFFDWKWRFFHWNWCFLYRWTDKWEFICQPIIAQNCPELPGQMISSAVEKQIARGITWCNHRSPPPPSIFIMFGTNFIILNADCIILDTKFIILIQSSSFSMQISSFVIQNSAHRCHRRYHAINAPFWCPRCPVSLNTCTQIILLWQENRQFFSAESSFQSIHLWRRIIIFDDHRFLREESPRSIQRTGRFPVICSRMRAG